MKIDQSDFAQTCLEKAVTFRVFAHYMVAVAMLQSGIADDAKGDAVGPFGLTPTDWAANCKDPSFGGDFDTNDINDWAAQCSVYALMTRRALDKLGSDATPLGLYAAQWPNNDKSKLSGALSDTAALITQAATDLKIEQNPESTVITDPAQPVPAGGATTPSAADTDLPVALQQKIIDIAANSTIIKHSWNKYGVAPTGYIKGMALVFASALGKLNAGDSAAKEMAKANTGEAGTDALAHYAKKFGDLGMKNDVDGVDTLRHLFVLLIGIGMAESSGIYSCGLDTTNANSNNADRAEAGLFQTSFDACTKNNSSLLPPLFSQLRQKNPTGFLSIFQEGVPISKRTIVNIGSGNGAEFQRLTKQCPLFAAEFAAIMFRVRCDHYGTIRDFLGELRPECDQMLQDVQNAVKLAGLIS